MTSPKDSIYASPVGKISTLKFDETVAGVFPDMIQRSVPGYSAIVSAIGFLAGRFAREHSVCYDLGCSLGVATLSMRYQIKAENCRIEDRLEFLQKIHQELLPGGILILSEKLKFDDDQQQELQTQMHHAFKKAQGYSDLEISQKRTALENVLITETFVQHQNRLKQVGFSSAEVWFQYFNFVSIIALK